MSDAAWGGELEERISRERTAVIDLLDASRALSGDFRPQGLSQADAEKNFADKYHDWRAAVDAINELAGAHLKRG